jgi:hypothetical protein
MTAFLFVTASAAVLAGLIGLVAGGLSVLGTWIQSSPGMPLKPYLETREDLPGGIVGAA